MEKIEGAIINQDCKCPKKECVRHGNCEECKESHASRGNTTHCQNYK